MIYLPEQQDLHCYGEYNNPLLETFCPCCHCSCHHNHEIWVLFPKTFPCIHCYVLMVHRYPSLWHSTRKLTALFHHLWFRYFCNFFCSSDNPCLCLDSGDRVHTNTCSCCFSGCSLLSWCLWWGINREAVRLFSPYFRYQFHALRQRFHSTNANSTTSLFLCGHHLLAGHTCWPCCSRQHLKPAK